MESLSPNSLTGEDISYPQDDPDIRAFSPRKKPGRGSLRSKRATYRVTTVYH